MFTWLLACAPDADAIAAGEKTEACGPDGHETTEPTEPRHGGVLRANLHDADDVDTYQKRLVDEDEYVYFEALVMPGDSVGNFELVLSRLLDGAEEWEELVTESVPNGYNNYDLYWSETLGPDDTALYQLEVFTTDPEASGDTHAYRLLTHFAG